MPKRILIGTVVSDITPPGSYARTYLVRPMVMPSDVTVVMVLLPGSGNVESAWKLPSADSLRRAVGTAGDSIARAAARRDTVPRDTTRPPP